MKARRISDEAIALDDESTWPGGLTDLLNSNFKTFEGYERERQRIDRQMKKNPPLTPRPINRHQARREELIDQIGNALKDVYLVGYHCTRLRFAEIDSIQASDGLQPLSASLLEWRVRKAILAGELTSRIGELLCARNQVRDDNRHGLLWFIFTQPLLEVEGGVGRFFRYWGGESLFLSHAENAETSHFLRRIGEPCIVEAAVPTQRVANFFGIGERLLRCYLDRREIDTSHSADVEGCVQETIGLELIRRIVKGIDPDFEKLTSCINWQEPPK